MGTSKRGRPLTQAPLEKEFQKRVMRDLRRIPQSFWFKINDRATIGIPDVVGGVNGYSVLVELKTKSRLTAIQFWHLEKADAARCQSFVATPQNWAEVYAYICSLNTIAPPAIAQLRKPARIPLWCLPTTPRWEDKKGGASLRPAPQPPKFKRKSP